MKSDLDDFIVSEGEDDDEDVDVCDVCIVVAALTS